jgi:hypothetical protein
MWAATTSKTAIFAFNDGGRAAICGPSAPQRQAGEPGPEISPCFKGLTSERLHPELPATRPPEFFRTK